MREANLVALKLKVNGVLFFISFFLEIIKKLIIIGIIDNYIN